VYGAGSSCGLSSRKLDSILHESFTTVQHEGHGTKDALQGAKKNLSAVEQLPPSTSLDSRCTSKPYHKPKLTYSLEVRRLHDLFVLDHTRAWEHLEDFLDVFEVEVLRISSTEGLIISPRCRSETNRQDDSLPTDFSQSATEFTVVK
jgi:hypothetical protein